MEFPNPSTESKSPLANASNRNEATNSTLRDHIRGTGLAALHELAETDPTFLQHYVATASGLWYDLLVELRGPLDRSTILAQRNLLRHDRGPDYPSRVRRMCEDYSVLQSDGQ